MDYTITIKGSGEGAEQLAREFATKLKDAGHGITASSYDYEVGAGGRRSVTLIPRSNATQMPEQGAVTEITNPNADPHAGQKERGGKKDEKADGKKADGKEKHEGKGKGHK